MLRDSARYSATPVDTKTDLAACSGQLPASDHSLSDRARGLRVLYAQKTVQIPALDWPAWTQDRPRDDARIGAQDPLCTIHASGSDPDEVESQIRFRSNRLLGLIHNMDARAA